MNAPLHGLRARLSSSGLSVHGPRQGAPTVITDVHGIDGTPAGAVYGPVTTAEAQSLVTALAGGGDPGGPDVPWMAVARSGDAGLAAAAATMLPSGLFWSWSDGGLTVATDPGSAAGIPRAVNPDYVRDYASGHADPQATPFVGVHRLTAGCTALWDGVQSQPRVTQWSGPAVWDEPELEGSMALEAYLAAFDIVVADLARRAGPLVATVSGGLDSTFVAAALAAATKSASPVRGLVYTPLPQARLVTAAGVVADESGAARALGNYYPGRLTIETVVDNAMIRPLDAALDIAHRSGVPTFNPANQPWLTAMRQIAAADGARLWFVGSNGNAAFSFTHPYAADYYLRRGEMGHLLGLGRGDEGKVSGSALRTRVLGPLRRRYLSRPAVDEHPLSRFGVVPPAGRIALDRAGYLAWLARSVTGLPAAGNPAAMEGVLMADPFASRAVIEVAASITPAEWVRGDLPRGFARRAGAGRVPDAIRRHTGRGQQGRDAWFVIRNDRDDYLDRIAALPEAAGLDHVDAAGLARHVASWPWGQVQGPSWPDHVAVDRLLSVAEFSAVW